MNAVRLDCMKPNTYRAHTGHFEQFVSDHQEQLIRFCARLTHNTWDAEDLAQETIARIFPRFSDSNPPLRNPGAYLRRTASNLWRDELRRRALPLPEAVEVESTDFSAQSQAALFQLLECLTPPQRVLVLLTDVLEFPVSEIARFLAIKDTAARVALHRARQKLKKKNLDELKDDSNEKKITITLNTNIDFLVDTLYKALRNGDARQIAECLMSKNGAKTIRVTPLHSQPADEKTLHPYIRCRRSTTPNELVWVSGNLEALPEGIRMLPFKKQ